MAGYSIARTALLSNLSCSEKRYQREFSKIFLTYLGSKKPTNKQIKEMQNLLSNVCIIRPLTLDKRLSNREKQCLQLAMLGKTIYEIAEIMCITIHTVNCYKRNIFKKLDCKNMNQAITQAIYFGILTSS